MRWYTAFAHRGYCFLQLPLHTANLLLTVLYIMWDMCHHISLYYQFKYTKIKIISCFQPVWATLRVQKRNNLLWTIIYIFILNFYVKVEKPDVSSKTSCFIFIFSARQSQAASDSPRQHQAAPDSTRQR